MKKNAVMIMLDSLQFNYLGCYGNDWIKTPNLDRFAKQATLFENAYTEGLPTIPCRRAMMTGRYTLPYKGWGPLDPEDSTIADICWGRGIHTALIYDSAPLRLPKYGYSRGFDEVIFKHGHELDHYFYSKRPLETLDPMDYMIVPEGMDQFSADYLKEEITCYLKLREQWRSDADSYVGVLCQTTLDWLDRVEKTEPFMLWLDCFDPHEPWDPPSVWEKTPCPYNPEYKGINHILPHPDMVDGVYTEDDLHHIRMLYAENVTMVDKWIGKVLDKIYTLGLWDETMIIVTSDHGEPMGHGEHGHGLMRKARPWPYEELAHVPLLIRIPGYGAGNHVKGFTQSCDIAPTLADWLDIVRSVVKHGVFDLPTFGTEDMQGVSLIPLIKGEVEKVRDFAIAGYCGFSWAIYTEDYSYIHWLSNSAGRTVELSVADRTEMASSMYDDLGFARDKKYKDLNKNEEMWCCTPGATSVPDSDELYDRKTDPFQLKNIIKTKPEVAKKMLETLKQFMSGLRAQ